MKRGEKIAFVLVFLILILIASAFIITTLRSKKIVSNNVEDFANIIEEIETNQRNGEDDSKQNQDKNQNENNNISNKSIESNVVEVEDINENVTVYTQKELENMALAYYEKQTGSRPKMAASKIEEDNKLTIQLYDNVEGHNSTAEWYIIDMNTASGITAYGVEVNFLD